MTGKRLTPEKLNELIGEKFGRLTVTGYKGFYSKQITSQKRHYYTCVCECGTEVSVQREFLLCQTTTSCGCYQKERTRAARRTHGMTDSLEYEIWRSMKARCYTPNNKNYIRYGGRGIVVCREWKDSFDAFLKDMGPKPGPDYSIDRIDNDRNYEPDNCRWATRVEQHNNKRNNIYLEFNGISKTMAMWRKELGVPHHILMSRRKYRGDSRLLWVLLSPSESVNGGRPSKSYLHLLLPYIV